MEVGNSSSSIAAGQRPDERLINEAIDFLLHDTGDKVVKSDESLMHLGNLEAAADNGGVSAAQFSQLVRIAVGKLMPARISQRFLATLVPSEPVQGECWL